MDGSIALFAGVDVSKRSLDLCLLPDDRRQSFSYDEQGLAQLLEGAARAGDLSDRGGSHRGLPAGRGR